MRETYDHLFLSVTKAVWEESKRSVTIEDILEVSLCSNRDGWSQEEHFPLDTNFRKMNLEVQQFHIFWRKEFSVGKIHTFLSIKKKHTNNNLKILLFLTTPKNTVLFLK